MNPTDMKELLANVRKAFKVPTGCNTVLNLDRVLDDIVRQIIDRTATINGDIGRVLLAQALRKPAIQATLIAEAHHLLFLVQDDLVEQARRGRVL